MLPPVWKRRLRPLETRIPLTVGPADMSAQREELRAVVAPAPIPRLARIETVGEQTPTSKRAVSKDQQSR
jgi:hypothetical protein